MDKMNEDVKKIEDLISFLSDKVTYLVLIVVAIACGIFLYRLLTGKHKITDDSKVNDSLFGSGLEKSAKPEGFIFGKSGRSKVYLPNKGEGHITVFGGSGKGKTSALLIPSLRAWSGPFFAIDISGDISENVREYIPKEDIVMLMPEHPDDADNHSYNVFRAIDEEMAKENPDQDLIDRKLTNLVYQIVDFNTGDSETAQYFLNTARNIFLAAMFALYEKKENDLKTGDFKYDFCDICKEVFNRDVQGILELVTQTVGKGTDHKALHYITSIANENEKNTSGAKSKLNECINLFANNSSMKKMLRRGGSKEFAPSMIENKRVFLMVSDAEQEYYSLYMKIIIEQLLEYISSRKYNRKTDRRILLAIDEFASIGHLNILGPFRKFRKNGANLCILTQSLADIDLTYNTLERDVILDNSQYVVVINANNNTTRDYFSNLVGREDKENKSVTNNTSGSSTSISTTRDYAINPEVWKNSAGKVFVIHPSGYIELKLNHYFKEKEKKKDDSKKSKRGSKASQGSERKSSRRRNLQAYWGKIRTRL